MNLSSLTTCVIVALIWGSTNNLIKHFTPKTENSTAEKSAALKFIYYLKNYKFTLSLLVNQLGSLYFTYSLGGEEISSFIPITNGLRLGHG